MYLNLSWITDDSTKSSKRSEDVALLDIIESITLTNIKSNKRSNDVALQDKIRADKMVLTSKPGIEIDASLLTEELTRNYVAPTPNAMAWSRERVILIERSLL